MATIEHDALMKIKDKDGNLNLIYPVTKAELVDGLDSLLAGKAAAISRGAYYGNLNYVGNSDGTLYDNSVVWFGTPNGTTNAPEVGYGLCLTWSNGGGYTQELQYTDGRCWRRTYYNDGTGDAWHAWTPVDAMRGSSGGWDYAIYRDGTCELWRTETISGVACSTALGSMYRSSGLTRTNYPFSVTDANIQASWRSDGYGAFLWPYSAGGTTTPPGYYLVRPVSTTGISGTLSYYVRGKKG